MKRKFKKSKKACTEAIITSHLDREHEDIIVCYIFGSFMTEELFSDIDVGIVTKIAPDKPLMFELELERKLEKIVGWPIDVRVLNQAPLSFCQNVIRQGKVIIDRDPNFRADFESQILKQYFDFAPFRKRYLKEVANAPV